MHRLTQVITLLSVPCGGIIIVSAKSEMPSLEILTVDAEQGGTHRHHLNHTCRDEAVSPPVAGGGGVCFPAYLADEPLVYFSENPMR